ncbi:MAG TPA: DUF4097 family beta strand repeat-containing protein [Ktedonobacteraceae bacterium]
MNEQEMQFADPDWKPTGPLSAAPGNTMVSPPMPATSAGTNSQADSVSQPAGFPAYDQGYQGAWSEQPSAGQPFAPPVPVQQTMYSPAGRTRGRGRSRWWIWVVIAVIFISMIGPMSRSFYKSSSFNTGQSPQQPYQMQKQAFALNGATELDINDLSDNITVQVSDQGSTDIMVLAGNDAQPQVSYQGQKMALVSNGNSNITIYIPQNVALHLSGGVNQIEVDGFSGLLTAQTDSGPITLNNDNLGQGSSLNTNSGNIDLEQSLVSNASITSTSGAINMNQVNLNGKVTVNTGGNSSINYSGSLDPQGNYQFTTDSGAINLTLPQGTAMQMKVSQKSGGFHSDFPPSSGSAPQATLGVTTNAGDITITQQQQ